MIFAATLLLPLAVIATDGRSTPVRSARRARRLRDRSRGAASTNSTSRKKLSKSEEAEALGRRMEAAAASCA